VTEHLAWSTLVEDIVLSGLTVSVWYDLLFFTPPFAVLQWFTGNLTGYQLLQLIELSVSVIFSATALHFFFWQVNLITSAEEVMYLFLFVCLSVFVQDYCKSCG